MHLVCLPLTDLFDELAGCAQFAYSRFAYYQLHRIKWCIRICGAVVEPVWFRCVCVCVFDKFGRNWMCVVHGHTIQCTLEPDLSVRHIRIQVDSDQIQLLPCTSIGSGHSKPIYHYKRFSRRTRKTHHAKCIVLIMLVFCLLLYDRMGQHRSTRQQQMKECQQRPTVSPPRCIF